MKKLVCSILLLILLGGCRERKNLENVTMRIHFPQITLNLDPHKMEDAYSMTVVQQLHRGLLRYTPSMDVVPDLAEKWIESEDHRTYLFTLKESSFSNGSPITATNVQMTFARMFMLGAAMGADLEYIQGVSEFRKTRDLAKLGIKAVSDRQIEFRLNHASALFLKHLAAADCGILPLKSFSEEIEIGSKTAFSGPYQIVSSSDDRVKIRKWRPDTFDSKLPPSEVDFILSSKKPIELANTSQTDSLDHDPISVDEVAALKKKGWKETPTELIAETYVIVNSNKISKQVREKLFSTVDQNELSRILGGNYIPAFGAIPRGVPGELLESDVKPIKKISKEIKGSINLEYDGASEMHIKIVNYLSSVWEPSGISVKKVAMAKKDLAKKRLSSQCEVCIGQKGLDYPDGYSVLTYFKSGFPANYFHVRDPKIDEMVNTAGKILEREKREKSYRDIQLSILQHFTLIPLVFGSTASGMWSERIESVPSHPMGLHMMSFEMIEMRKQ